MVSSFPNTFVTPPKQDFNTEGFQGSMQKVLQDNIGNYVIVDFVTGSDTIVSKQGILYSVSSQFLVLYDDINLRYVVCDIFSVKFVTFLLPGYRPGQVPSPVLAEEEEAIREDNGLPTLDENTSAALQMPAQEPPEAQDMQQTVQPEPAVETMARMPAKAAFSFATRRKTDDLTVRSV